MNRQQRRKIERQSKKIKRPLAGMTKEEKMAALVKNGITIEDLEKEWHDGFTAGFEKASPGTTRTCYAAFALALHELLGFGKVRLSRVLSAVDEHVCNTLVSQEIIDEVYQKAGIILNFQEPFDRVDINDEAKPWRKKT